MVLLAKGAAARRGDRVVLPSDHRMLMEIGPVQPAAIGRVFTRLGVPVGTAIAVLDRDDFLHRLLLAQEQV
jgi:hypothetical protein